MAVQGTPVESTALAEDIPNNSQQPVAMHTLDTACAYGAFHLFHELSCQAGLLPLLQKAFPETCNEIFTLACFLVELEEPVMYCEE